MPADRSVTGWLGELESGNSDAAELIWNRYFSDLVTRVRSILGHSLRTVADEEDIAVSAFASFCRGVEEKRFPRLQDRKHLWHMLLKIAARKVAHQIRDQKRSKRGGGLVRPATDVEETNENLMAMVIGSEPSPELAAQVAEQYRSVMILLEDDEMRTIANKQMEGYTVKEIAAALGKAERTIARKLAIIRERWEEVSS
ncbi:MAG: RNA polymerase subunit sigma-70 [Planctomycetia bacterium]|nr:RNA polymerase subunit sigma-70 [Planctomycetia bacterium]